MSCSVHDVTDLEARGIPAAYVATEAFVDGAERQAKALGFDPVVVWVSHPIQDRTDEEMRAIAGGAFAAIVAGLTSPPLPVGERSR